MNLLKLKKTFNKVIEEMKGIFVYLVEGISNFFKKENKDFKYVELNQSIMESSLYQDESIPLVYNLDREPKYDHDSDSDSDSATLCNDTTYQYQNTIRSKNEDEDVVYGLHVDDVTDEECGGIDVD